MPLEVTLAFARQSVSIAGGPSIDALKLQIQKGKQIDLEKILQYVC